MTREAVASLRRRQVDRVVRGGAGLAGVAPPQRGWIAETRKLIGMRAAQLAARLGVTQAAVAQFERAEAERTITLQTLEKVAAALDCRLVYAFVPRTSFEELVRARAERVARQQVGGVDHTMALEDQALAQEAREDLIRELTDQLVRTLPRELWDEER